MFSRILIKSRKIGLLGFGFSKNVSFYFLKDLFYRGLGGERERDLFHLFMHALVDLVCA